MKIYGSLKKLVQCVFTQQTSVASPAAGSNALYFKTDNNLYMKNSGGTETQVNGGSTSVATPTSTGTVTSYFPTIQSAVKSVSGANYTVTTMDGYEEIVVTTGAADRTITLPALSANDGRVITIKHKSDNAGDIIIARNGSDKIENASADFTLKNTPQRNNITLFGDNTGGTWWIRSFPVAQPTVVGSVSSYFPVIQSSVKILSSADYTVTATDGYSVVLVSTGSSDRTVTLPAAASSTGRTISIVKTDSGTGFVLIDGNSSETIDGELVQYIMAQYDRTIVTSDGTSWYMLQSAPEYVYNTSTNDTDNSTSFAYGPDGGSVPTVDLSGDRTKRVRFKTAIQSTDLISVQLKSTSSGGQWQELASALPLGVSPGINQGNGAGKNYGLSSSRVVGSTTDVEAYFNRYATPANTYGGAGNGWSGVTNVNWRMRKIRS